MADQQDFFQVLKTETCVSSKTFESSKKQQQNKEKPL